MSRRAWILAALLAALASRSGLAQATRGDGAGSPATAEALGFDPSRLDSVVAYLRTELDSGAFPGAVVAVGRHGQLALLRAVGVYGLDDRRPVDSATIYDVASLTKVVGLTTACMLLVRDGRLDLNAPAQRYFSEFRGAGKERVTIRQLLTHSSGLPAWWALFKDAETRAQALALVDTTPLEYEPGTRTIYSDLGAIVLTQVVERITGQRIDRFLDSALFRPLDMRTTRYLPPAEWRDRIAPTEMDTVFRHRMVRGEVHDENTGRLDGISGHAGLFSNALDLVQFAGWLLDQWHGRPAAETPGHGPGVSPPALPPELVREFTRRQSLVPGSSRALGWDTPSEGSSAGTKLASSAFGHTGFTGTSIWMDPEKDLVLILLTNRVHPTRANTRIFRVRRRVADLAVDALTHPER